MMQRRRFLGTLAGAAGVGLAAAGMPARAQRAPDVIFLPSDYSTVVRMLKLAGVTREDVVYDLGCGDGRVVVTAARQFGARGVGIDVDAARLQDARDLAARTGATDRVRFVLGDLFSADIGEATVVTLFLLTELNLRLRPKLLAELKPGTRIVSHAFAMGDWVPEKTEVVDTEAIELTEAPNTERTTHLYLWRVPAHGPAG